MQNPSLPYTDQLTGLAIGEGGLYNQNYTGPYISDGKFQESVEFGEAEALDYLDYLSRMHDSAYAKYHDDDHREAADIMYAREAEKIKKLFPQFAARAVAEGNYASRTVLRHYSPTSMIGAMALKAGLGTLAGGLVGLTVQGVRNILQANQMANGTYRKDEMEEIEKYYRKDPHREKYLDKFSAEILKGVNPDSQLAKEIQSIKTKRAKQVEDDRLRKIAADSQAKMQSKEYKEDLAKKQTIWDAAHAARAARKAEREAEVKPKGIIAAIKEKVFPSKVTPTESELANSQAARWARFQGFYEDAEASKRSKKKKKTKRQKPNVKRAVKVLPHLYM